MKRVLMATTNGLAGRALTTHPDVLGVRLDAQDVELLFLLSAYIVASC